MADPHLALTALPNGIDPDTGAARVAVLLTPRTDRSAVFQQTPFVNWTERLLAAAGASRAIHFDLVVDGTIVPVVAPLRVEPGMWPILFDHLRATQSVVPNDHVNSDFRAPQVDVAAVIQDAQLALLMAVVAGKTEGRVMERAGDDVRATQKAAAKAFAAISAPYNLYMTADATAAAWRIQEELEETLRARAALQPGIVRDLARLGAELDGGSKLTPAAISALLDIHGVGHPRPGVAEAESILLPAGINAAERRANIVRMSLQYDSRHAPGIHDKALAAAEDFHRTLARVTQHPALLASLGLVLDVEVEVSRLHADGRLSASVPGGLAGVPVDSRVTRYDYRGASRPGARDARFVPKSRPQNGEPGMTWGMLRVDNRSVFTLDNGDRAGNHMKAVHQAESFARAATHESTIEDSNDRSRDAFAKVPAPRTAGIALVWKGRDKQLKAGYREARAMLADERARLNRTATAQEDLFAEKLVVGYRVDVWDDHCDNDCDNNRNAWNSLCARTGSYKFLDAAGKPISFQDSTGKWQTSWTPTHPLDVRRLEGVVRQGVVKPRDGGGDLIEVPETLFRWDNWSLTTPFVERPVQRRVTPRNAAPDVRLRVQGIFEVPDGSLTPLRYAVGYRFRCRAVDAAGNSLTAAECDPRAEPTIPPPPEPPFTYTRYEPVAAPVVALSEPIDPSESPGEQVNRIVIRRETGRVSARWLVAPRVAQKTAEIHRRFDEDGLVKGGLRVVRLQEDGSLLTVAQLRGIEPVPPEHPELNNPIVVFDRHHGGSEECGYYPDPCALTAAIDLLDDTGHSLLPQQMFRFYRDESWPNASPFFVELRHGDDSMPREAPAKWRWRSRRVPELGRSLPGLEITLRPRTIAILRVTSAFESTREGEHCLEAMAVWQLLSRQARTVRMRENTLRGAVPLISPPTELTLIHAVARPPRPHLTIMSSDRPPAVSEATYVDLVGSVGLANPQSAHLRHAVAKMTGEATWSEWVDDLSDDEPRRRSNAATVLDQRISASHAEDRATFGVRHEFEDTRHRVVHYRASVASRHEEYYAGQRPRRFTAASEPVRRVIASSTRPKAPIVSYIVPTFQWEPHKHDDEKSLARRGGGLRVYLERPWYSSGDGELLGVVLLPDGEHHSATLLARIAAALRLTDTERAADVLDAMVTQWGADPIWAGGHIGEQPGIASFRVGRAPVHGLRVPELVASGPPAAESIPVTVLPYEPRYDRERKLWYCDVEMDPTTTYGPFVRFALVRYQPNSVKDMELSAVTRADFAQLVPDRIVTVTTGGRDRLRVTVEGPTYRRSRSGEAGSMMHVVVEERRRIAHDTSWHIALNEAGKPIEARVQPSQLHAGAARWTAELELDKKSLRRYRVTVREYEHHAADDGTSLIRTVPVQRLVYAGMITL